MDIRRLAMKHVVPVACGAHLQRHKKVCSEIARALTDLAMLSTPAWTGSALFEGPLPPACPASVVREAVAAADAVPDILVRKRWTALRASSEQAHCSVQSWRRYVRAWPWAAHCSATSTSVLSILMSCQLHIDVVSVGQLAVHDSWSC